MEPTQYFIRLPVYASNCEHLPCMATQLNINSHPVKLQNYSPVRTGVFVGKTEQKANLRNSQHALENRASLLLLWA